ncbi:Cell division GTPase [Thermoplasmatales archaeon BRNA1]|nr:Cell division GTPase [Thermoplasmatales archaeon BRNA1]
MNAISDIAVSGDARIAVIGVGGAGCRIVSMLYGKMSRVGVIAVNTDRKALEDTSADYRMYICKEVTKGLGTRGDARLGKKCAQIHADELREVISQYDYAFIVAGMGGGTGSGASPVIADICASEGLHYGAVAIMPFSFESDRATRAAEGFRALHVVCKDVVRFENDRALTAEGVSTLDDAMNAINEAICKTVDGVVSDIPVTIRTAMAKHAEERRATAVAVPRPLAI